MSRPATAPAPDARAPLAVSYKPLDSLKPYPKNARTHSASQLTKLENSLVEYGWTTPIAAAGPDIIAGHGRLLAALALRKRGQAIAGHPDPDTAPVIDLSHLSPAQRRAYVLADNRLALDAGWDDDLLRVELIDLRDEGFDLGMTGFDIPELDLLFAEPEAAPSEDEEGASHDPDAGALLERINITIDEPRHTVARGDHYLLADRHHLVCASVLKDWPTWTPLLVEGAIFCPYPGPFVPYGETADTHPLVMVQSDPYIAGHLLDRYEEIHGPGSVVLVAPSSARQEPPEA